MAQLKDDFTELKVPTAYADKLTALLARLEELDNAELADETLQDMVDSALIAVSKATGGEGIMLDELATKYGLED